MKFFDKDIIRRLVNGETLILSDYDYLDLGINKARITHEKGSKFF